ncbi:MAG: arginine decarboxylase [Clostridiales bacterium]|jgi:arginine/lysine/ornithine decarboxylase|nr:arginine decarboxylase [Clostridiales bacterium]
MRLFEALEKIKKEALISFHMPGHKNGRLIGEALANPLAIDITEIPGADHLHEAHDCIAETEQSIAEFYGAAQSKLLVGGSTAGILSMILGTTRRGEVLLLNRNAHLSAYNAVQLGELEPVYLLPKLERRLGIPLGFDLETFKRLIEAHPEAKACLLTYPTYEGVCYSIREMIEICHDKGIVVLVDEAHGAHLKLNDAGPSSALDLGADVVVQSFHKTLPAMTQVACLHIGKKNILSERQLNALIWHLRALQSSSPSYVLMASADLMLSVIERDGVQKTKEMVENIRWFYDETAELKTLGFRRFADGDPGKLLLEISREYYERGDWDGFRVSSILREKYGIQSEYETERMCLFMAGLANEKKDFETLASALIEMDKKILSVEKARRAGVLEGENLSPTYELVLPQRVLSAAEAAAAPFEAVPSADCVGRIAAEYVIPYPPGIPVLVPGERIPDTLIATVKREKNEIKVLR